MHAANLWKPEQAVPKQLNPLMEYFRMIILQKPYSTIQDVQAVYSHYVRSADLH